MGLTRLDLLAKAADLKQRLPREAYDIQDLGTVTVRGMTAKERDQAHEKARITRGRRRGELDLPVFRAYVLVACILDDEGKALFQPADIEELLGLPPVVIDGLMGVINRLSGFGDDETEALKNVSASPAASDGSASGSPAN